MSTAIILIIMHNGTHDLHGAVDKKDYLYMNWNRPVFGCYYRMLR
jgi:hypothetical protein